FPASVVRLQQGRLACIRIVPVQREFKPFFTGIKFRIARTTWRRHALLCFHRCKQREQLSCHTGQGETMSDAAVVSAHAARAKVRLTVLLALAVFITYVDRGSLATAAPLLSRELAFSPAQMGVLLSAFFWSYTPTQLVVGWLAERYGVRWLL